MISIDLCANGNFLDYERVLDSCVEDVYMYLDFKAGESFADEAERKFQENQRKINKK